jgi:hypothetical protein
MTRKNYSFEKRQRGLAKKKKKEAKREEKAAARRSRAVGEAASDLEGTNLGEACVSQS